jgi:catechol 2,3-dioxygenase-like lactoylglutathione lyase family enzyme
MPPGGEQEARAFYGRLLGLEEVAKPPALARQGGCWFRRGELELHLGVEEDFRPARKAHPALMVDDLDDLAHRLEDLGIQLTWDGDLPGYRRFHTTDPFGNRLELLEVERPNTRSL